VETRTLLSKVTCVTEKHDKNMLVQGNPRRTVTFPLLVDLVKLGDLLNMVFVQLHRLQPLAPKSQIKCDTVVALSSPHLKLLA